MFKTAQHDNSGFIELQNFDPNWRRKITCNQLHQDCSCWHNKKIVIDVWIRNNKWLCLFVLFKVSVLKAYLDHIWITSLTLSSFIFFFFLKSSGICRRFGLIYREGYNIIRKKLIKTRYAKTFFQTFLLLFLVQKTSIKTSCKYISCKKVKNKK